MKKIFFILLMFSGSHTFGQNFDVLMSKKQLDCSDISYNSSLLFEKYYNANMLDSAKTLLIYWQGKCGLREPLHRARVLLAIKEGNFSDTLLTERILSYVFNYQNRMDMIKFNNYYSYDNYKPYYGFIPVGQEFDKFTKKAFNDLTLKHKPEEIEHLLCEFYSNNYDTIFSKIQTASYNNSILVKEYNKTVETYKKMPEFNLAWITGIWIPTGDLRKLGSHPELGFQIGSKKRKMNYDITMLFKFGNSANKYYARRTESSDFELTNHFFGGYIGLDIGRDILHLKAMRFKLLEV